MRELITYTRAKHQFLASSRQLRGKRSRTSRSPSPERIDPILNLTPDTCLAHGRRSAVHLGLMPGLVSPAMSVSNRGGVGADAGGSIRDPGEPVAIKICSLQSIRGPPPPAHPCVNPVLGRSIDRGQCIEERLLCEGELFDSLAESCLVRHPRLRRSPCTVTPAHPTPIAPTLPP